MKIKSGKIFITLVLVALMGASATSFAAQRAVADTGIAGADLREVEEAQVLAQASVGYASVDELISITTELGKPLPTRPGREISVVASADRQHYIVATTITDGILIRSDDHREPVKCDSYSTECISQLTADPTLVSAAPIWRVY
jgi:hypothetical protein